MLDKNQIFSFERGAYFSGDLRYAIVVNEGRYVFKGEAFNDFYWMDNCEFEIPEKEIEVLKKIVRPVEFWQKKYEAEDEIDDGFGWNIDFKYKDIFVGSGGYEKYPPNYGVVIWRLQRFVERIGAKYNKNYQRKGKLKRMML